MRGKLIAVAGLAGIVVGVLSVSGCGMIRGTITPEDPRDTTPPTATQEPQARNVAVAISPSRGPGGTEVEVAVTGLAGETEIQLGIGRKDDDYDIVASRHTDRSGTLIASLDIPSTAQPGEEWVVMAISAEAAATGVSNTFEVTEVSYEPSVAVLPEAGAVGEEITVVAEGFPPEEAVEIGIGRVDSEYDVVAREQTDVEGRMETQITIPSFVEPAHRWVIVVAADRRGLRAVSDEIDISEVSTPRPSATGVITKTMVYLVAVGDDGQFGEPFGCNDSLVGLEVGIEPTQVPLRAALEKLLTIDSRQCGGLQLYNALYGADLELDGVTVGDGEAVIRLSGNLILGGVCDEPRVWAQLRETALQYETVDDVTVFVDDTPLEDLLRMDID